MSVHGAQGLLGGSALPEHPLPLANLIRNKPRGSHFPGVDFIDEVTSHICFTGGHEMRLVLVTGITVKGRTTLQVYGQVLSCGALPHPTDKGLGLES